jgi:hypothetical protein
MSDKIWVLIWLLIALVALAVLGIILKRVDNWRRRGKPADRGRDVVEEVPKVRPEEVPEVGRHRTASLNLQPNLAAQSTDPREQYKVDYTVVTGDNRASVPEFKSSIYNPYTDNDEEKINMLKNVLTAKLTENERKQVKQKIDCLEGVKAVDSRSPASDELKEL